MKLSELYTINENHEKSNPLAELETIANSLNIPLTIIGGIAVRVYGYKRYTEDVDILVKKSQVDNLANSLIQHGFEYIGQNKLKKGSWIVNICAEGVKAGSVVFPPPENDKGIEVASLPLLIMLKVKANRERDRGDVVELIKRNDLSLGFLESNVVGLNNIESQLLFKLHSKAVKEKLEE